MLGTIRQVERNDFRQDAGAGNTTRYDHHLAEQHQCDSIPNPQIVHARKRYSRSNRNFPGYYNIRLVKGERCTEVAVMSMMRDGKTIRRCAKHIGSDT